MVGLTIVSIVLFFFVRAPIVQHEHLRKLQIDEATKSVRASNRQSVISAVHPEDI